MQIKNKNPPRGLILIINAIFYIGILYIKSVLFSLWVYTNKPTFI